MTKTKEERIITKEKAVFWMDEHGRWCNAHGPFEHKKIIRYFNSSIRRDDAGYFVAQEYDGLMEKVYFRYQVTPLFALDLIETQPPRLLLNTESVIELRPENLFLLDDCLYMYCGDECIKCSPRVMLKLSDRLKFEDGVCSFQFDDATWRPICEIKGPCKNNFMV